MLTIAEGFDVFARANLAQDAPPELVKLARRAFYAGAGDMAVLIAELNDESRVSEEEASDRFEALGLELQAFTEAIAAGGA